MVNVYPGLSLPVLSHKGLTIGYVLEVPIATYVNINSLSDFKFSIEPELPILTEWRKLLLEVGTLEFKIGLCLEEP